MFTTRPLTWLFIIATISVDLALVATRGNQGEYRYVVGGYVIGQVAALAIWAVRGHTHRLLRVSCFVFASGMLVRGIHAAWEDLTFAFVYAMAIFVFALIVEVTHTLQDNADTELEQRKRWRFPLIEFFGWTIVVAVVSLGTRQMRFEIFFDDSRGWLVHLVLLSLVAVPFLLVLFTRKDLRDLRAIKALTLVSAATAAGWHFSLHGSSLFTVTQTTYLVAWMAVLTLDNIRAETNHVLDKLRPETLAVETPKIYKPHPLD